MKEKEKEPAKDVEKEMDKEKEPAKKEEKEIYKYIRFW